MTEQAANVEAANIVRRWANIVRHWATLYQPTLTLLGAPFADTPHWQPALAKSANAPTDAEIAAFRDRPPTADEIAEAYGPVEVNGEMVQKGVTIEGVFELFKLKMKVDVANDELGRTAAWTTEKNLRCALRHFDENMPIKDLTNDLLAGAKAKMKALSRRTAQNYLDALKRMLVWFYKSPYGGRHEKPEAESFDRVFIVKNRTKTGVKIYGFDELKTLLSACADRQLLYAMLALNCGMYQADIGRLTHSEINLSEGYIFWDREKEPDNLFRVRHDLWPETLMLVKKFIQPTGTKPRLFTDYRRHEPAQIDCSSLAFVNESGDALYRVRPTGKAYDLIGKCFARVGVKDNGGKAFQFHNLRKATNKALKELLRNKVDGNERGQIIAVTEISETYLAHKSPELQMIYDARGVEGFAVMNRYLGEVGNALRNFGAFASRGPSDANLNQRRPAISKKSRR